ncbi:MAG TPA: putative sulfate exporter family transporter [Usitatibacter sp.]|jgi:uncharacterized membrane protein YadS|nr:putative sulfate exporter family transporter [Usitatibacter sp.]
MSQPAIKLTPARGFADPLRLAERAVLACPGLALTAVVSIAATYFSDRFKLSAMVFALLLGMAFNFIADARFRPGIEMASRAVLRAGVALLGLRITLAEVATLGWSAIALAAGGIVLTMAMGVALARALRLGDRFGLLSGGAVSICGASATLAINAVLPKDGDSDRDATFVVAAVTGLSTLAMFLYPLVAGLAGLDDRAAGIFFGGTPMLPWFAAAFAALMILASFGWIPARAMEAGGGVSKWFLAIAMAGIGMKTSLRGLVAVGPRAMLLVLAETAFIALLVLGAICGVARQAASAPRERREHRASPRLQRAVAALPLAGPRRRSRQLAHELVQGVQLGQRLGHRRVVLRRRDVFALLVAADAHARLRVVDAPAAHALPYLDAADVFGLHRSTLAGAATNGLDPSQPRGPGVMGEWGTCVPRSSRLPARPRASRNCFPTFRCFATSAARNWPASRWARRRSIATAARRSSGAATPAAASTSSCMGR